MNSTCSSASTTASPATTMPGPNNWQVRSTRFWQRDGGPDEYPQQSRSREPCPALRISCSGYFHGVNSRKQPHVNFQLFGLWPLSSPQVLHSIWAESRPAKLVLVATVF